MKFRRIVTTAVFFTATVGSFLCAEENPFEKNNPVPIRTEADRLLEADWKRNAIKPPQECSDSVFVRRVWLDFAGRLPSIAEAQAFVANSAPDKRDALIERLLNSEEFVQYWTMRWCDALRVKSEFPINLWPNAVYGYQRRIAQFLRTNEPFDQFVRALLTSSGSNFRDMESNFYRANASPDPESIAATVALTFLGRRFDRMSEAEQKNLTAFFDRVAFKSTREWKEEIVYLKPGEGSRILIRPDGVKIPCGPDQDPRELFCDYLFDRTEIGPKKQKVNRWLKPLWGGDFFHESDRAFARATVNRVWFWIFGKGLTDEPDDLGPDNPPVNPPLEAFLAEEFLRSGYDFRKLCRMIADTAAYRASSFPQGGNRLERQTALRHFASYPVRRLPAEVVADVLCDLTDTKMRYSSVIPEPFSFLPSDTRSIDLADGSISSQFLILFGRPARDSGVMSERNDAINTKQRLYLFNSKDVNDRLYRISRNPEVKKNWFPQNMDAYYWLFYSRPATAEEKQLVKSWVEATPKGQERWRVATHLCWILLNSKEFLYQH